ncbi:MAG: putative hydroxymethylpyrimidine transporter CytX [Candidatus Korarchaeota archaeon NZ13-K]|nr:MAG: putative hydroxymethylpyrimidine transporter CytX [Candidatus Korarchaeota archaeon NZ13-K]
MREGRGLLRAPPEWGVEPVREEVRILRGIDFFFLWFSLGVGLLVLQAGALLMPSLTIGQALLVSLAGSLVGSLLLALAGILGSKYGVPTMVSLRPIFGTYGSYLATFLNFLQLVGWTAFELKVMMDSASLIWGGEDLRALWLLFFSLVVLGLALGGPLAFVRKWIERFAVWLVMASTLWITYQALNRELGPTGTGEMPLTLALDLVIAMPISWMPLVSDYNRFSSSVRSGFLGTLVGYTVANTWFYFLGAVLAAISGQAFVSASILGLYLGGVALVAILVDETDNAYADVYSSAISLQNAFPRLRQWKIILVVMVISALLAYWVPLANYEWFLLMIGASFIPLFGVVISEFFLVRRADLSLEEFYERAPRLVARSIASWILGLLTYFAIALRIPELGASIPSFLVSLIAQYLMGRWKLGLDRP